MSSRMFPPLTKASLTPNFSDLLLSSSLPPSSLMMIDNSSPRPSLQDNNKPVSPPVASTVGQRRIPLQTSRRRHGESQAQEDGP